MFRTAQFFTGLGFLVLLQACGGGGGAPAPAANPPPAPPARLALDASNYQGALSRALDTSNAAFGFAKLGADAADRLFNAPLSLPFPIQCPVSGTASIELTDRNRNGALNEDDSVHIFMQDCNSGANPLTGVVRIEILSAAQIANGREYEFRVEVDNLLIAPAAGGAPVSIDFIGLVNFTRTADYDHYVLTFGDYRYASSGQTRFATNLVVDYLQDYVTLSYDYLVQGTLGGSEISGQYDVTTPTPLTGTIGAYPNSGRMNLAGGANSSALLSEEGPAAANSGAVLIAVDSNGDGTAEAAVQEFTWSSLLPPEIFTSLRDQLAPVALPIP